uniref:Uncharacterized protein n=1 Tax=Leersia perrieri TaxID=77586 RepID=A0A0D9VJJ2_9ORYZ
MMKLIDTLLFLAFSPLRLHRLQFLSFSPTGKPHLSFSSTGGSGAAQDGRSKEASRLLPCSCTWSRAGLEAAAWYPRLLRPAVGEIEPRSPMSSSGHGNGALGAATLTTSALRRRQRRRRPCVVSVSAKTTTVRPPKIATMTLWPVTVGCLWATVAGSYESIHVKFWSTSWGILVARTSSILGRGSISCCLVDMLDARELIIHWS